MKSGLAYVRGRNGTLKLIRDTAFEMKDMFGESVGGSGLKGEAEVEKLLGIGCVQDAHWSRDIGGLDSSFLDLTGIV